MTHYAANGAFLLLGILFVPGASGQDPPSASPQDVADVIVRPVSEVGTIERLMIALTRAFVPVSKVFSPLYSYGRELACGENRDAREAVLEHPGPAALVYDDNGVTRARYHQNTAAAIKYAEDSGWCRDKRFTTWSLATTSPLDSDDIKEEQRYLSREVGRVDLQLQARRD